MRKKYTSVVQAVPAPPSTSDPETAITAGAAWTHTLSFDAGLYRYAEIRLKTADAFLVWTDGTDDPAKDGCSYPVNAPLRLIIPTDATHLHVKRDDAANDSTVTITLFED